MSKIEIVSEILNDTKAYNKIGEALGIEIDNDSDIFREIEEFIVEKFKEMSPQEDIEFNIEAIVEITDEDGEHVEDKTVLVNIFAKDEEEAESKAEDNIREQNPQYEDFCIDIVGATES